jgi:hypothetical protein
MLELCPSKPLIRKREAQVLTRELRDLAEVVAAANVKSVKINIMAPDRQNVALRHVGVNTCGITKQLQYGYGSLQIMEVRSEKNHYIIGRVKY